MIYNVKAPAKYIQQCGVMETLYKILYDAFPDNNFVLLLSERSFHEYVPDWERFAEEAEVPAVFSYVIVPKNATELTILDRLQYANVVNSRTVFVGVGGGHILDITKYVSREGHCVLVPTLFSGDAACTSMAVRKENPSNISTMVYRMPNPIDYVIVDPEVIVTTPIEYFKAGFCDILATYYECFAGMYSKHITMTHGDYLPTTRILASKLLETLSVSNCDYIFNCVRSHKVTRRFEDFLYYGFYISGFLSENGGIHMAHAFSAAYDKVRPGNSVLHGYKVSVGLALMLEYYEEYDGLFIYDNYIFTSYQDKLPRRVSQIGPVFSDEEVSSISKEVAINKYVEGDSNIIEEILRRDINK